MNRATVAAFVAVATCLTPVLRAQMADSDTPAFEVASLKRSAPIDPRRARFFEWVANDTGLVGRLPGSNKGKVTIKGWSAAELVAAAYRVPLRQIGGPSWIFDARYVIEALIPSDQPRAKAPEMLRTLLEERLALKAHREVRRMSGYILSVGKDGPKLEETGPPTPTTDLSKITSSRIRRGFSGFQLDHGTMAQLAGALAWNLKAPVEDRTGLKGFYVILIENPASEMSEEFDRPALFRRALSAYGLHLAGRCADGGRRQPFKNTGGKLISARSGSSVGLGSITP